MPDNYLQSLLDRIEKRGKPSKPRVPRSFLPELEVPNLTAQGRPGPAQVLPFQTGTSPVDINRFERIPEVAPSPVSARVTGPQPTQVTDRQIKLFRSNLEQGRMNVEQFMGFLDTDILKQIIKPGETIEYKHKPSNSFAKTTAEGIPIFEDDLKNYTVDLRPPFRPSPTGGAGVPAIGGPDILNRINTTLVNAATAPVVKVGGINLSVSDIAALGALGYGGYQVITKGIPAAFNALMKNSIERNLKSWSRTQGITLDKATRKATSDYIVRNANPSWLRKEAFRTLFRPVKGKIIPTPAAEQAADQYTTALLKQVFPQRIPKVSAVNTGVPGQTMTQAEIISKLSSVLPESAKAVQAGEARLGKPAEIRKTLPTTTDTNTLIEVQSQAKEFGLDVEAVQGISENEYWISITLPALKSNPKFTEWLTGIRNQNPESANRVERLLVGKFEQTLGEPTDPGFGRKRFVPFKNIQDAQSFINGDISKIATELSFRGPTRIQPTTEPTLPPQPRPLPGQQGLEIEAIRQDANLLREEHLYIQTMGTKGAKVESIETGKEATITEPVEDYLGNTQERSMQIQWDDEPASQWVVDSHSFRPARLERDIADVTVGEELPPFPQPPPAAPKPISEGVVPEPARVDEIVAEQPKPIVGVTPKPETSPLARRQEVQSLLEKPAKELPKGTTKIALRQELKKLNKEILPREKKLRQDIMAVLKTRGIPASQYRPLFRTKGGNSYLTNIQFEGLEKILKASKTVRPVSIHGKRVVKESTEKALHSLKSELIEQGKFSEEAYQQLLKENKLTTDRYEGVGKFISESEAKSLIRQINRQAEIGLIEWDNSVSKGLQDKPDLSKAIDSIKSSVFRPEGEVGVSPWFDMPIYMQRLQERTGSRIYDVYIRAARISDENERRLQLRDEKLAKLPGFKEIVKDKESLQRISDYIASKHKMGPERPENITEHEIAIAEHIEKELFSYRPTVRYERFVDSYYKNEGDIARILKDIPNAPREDIVKASDIYESNGADKLLEYLKDKDWGVIKSGYEPHVVINPKLQLHKIKATVIGKGRLKTRAGIEFAPQDKNILDRRRTYMRQMEAIKFDPYFREIDRIFSRDVAPKLQDASAIKHNIELGIEEMRGYFPQEWFAKIAMRMAGFTFSTLSLSPHMFVRNLFQNPALHPDFPRIFSPTNKVLNAQEQEYVKTYVSQQKAVLREWLMQEGMGNTLLERIVRKITYYGKSDQINRDIISMFLSLNKSKRALLRYKSDGNIKKFINSSGMNDMSKTEQLEVLEMMALDEYKYGIESLKPVKGEEAAIREIAEFITTRTHLRYKRRFRAPVEMGVSGRILGNLMTFPRGVVQKMYLHFEKMAPTSKSPLAQKKRAVKALIAAAVGMYLAGETYRKLTGKPRNPYDILTMILGWSPGGLATGSIEGVTAVFNDVNGLLHGEDWAADNLVKDLPRAGEMFIPFYNQIVNILEAAADQKYLDRKVLRQVREIFDDNYELNEEFYEKERTWFEKIQHAVFGGEQPDPEAIETAPADIDTAISKLGRIDTEARTKAIESASTPNDVKKLEEKDWTFTMTDLGNAIRTSLKGIDDLAIDELDLPDLVGEYQNAQLLIDEYYNLMQDGRWDWRRDNPETEAALVLWRGYKTMTTPESESIVRKFIRKYDISENAVVALQLKEGRPAPTPTPTQRPSYRDLAKEMMNEIMNETSSLTPSSTTTRKSYRDLAKDLINAER